MGASPSDENDNREHLLAKLRVICVYDGAITPSLDVVYDLGLAGDDLEDLLIWLHEDHQVDFSRLKAKDLPLNEPPQRTHTLFGKKRFKSMTVGALLQAMQTKRWSWA